MERKYFYIFMLFFTSFFLKIDVLFAQSSSDCVGAIPFCSGPGQGTPTVSPGDGNVPNETRLSCVDNEGFSTWYTFTVTSNGTFNFVLTPVDLEDDYDWALFNMTGRSCADIPNDPSLIASCNSWGSPFINGTTGISTALGGVGNQNGPGTQNGPPFNQDLQVSTGETYVLMVSNWSQSTQGFNIDVSASTAGGVYSNSGISNLTNQEFCKGDTPSIDISFTGVSSGSLNYSWTPAHLFVDPTVQDPAFKDPIEETTNIQLDFANGVCNYSLGATMYVGTIDYNKKDINICVGERAKLGIEFTGITLPSGLRYDWSPSISVINHSSPTPTTVPLFNTSTFYFDLQNGPCRVNDSIEVIIYNDTVNADFEYFKNDNENTIPIEIDFNNLTIGAQSHLWLFSGGNSSSNEVNPLQHEFPGYDTYQVTLISTSPSTYCIDTVTKTIEYPDVIFPNIITPNEDDVNDALWITGLKLGTGLKIYNRWGRLVYEEENYLHDWSGEGLADGTYYCEYIFNDNKKKGWIQISR